jgi:hypothetical protein
MVWAPAASTELNIAAGQGPARGVWSRDVWILLFTVCQDSGVGMWHVIIYSIFVLRMSAFCYS